MIEQTLAGHFDKFSEKEKGVLLFAVNTAHVLSYDLHKGTLPFVKVKDVLSSLVLLNSTQATKWRVAAVLHQKLRKLSGFDEDYIVVLRYLDKKKVAKRFGIHPEHGKAIPMAASKKVTVGVRFNLGLVDKNGNRGDYEPDRDVLVKPHMVVRPLGQGKWEVTVAKQYLADADRYLSNFCM